MSTRALPQSLSYFFPAYNEAGNVGPSVEDALQVLPRFAAEFEIIIVDDGSRDATEAEARELAAANARVRYVRHPVNRGYGEALRTGMATAGHEVVFFTDGDRQFDLADLERAWPLLGEADVVAGYRIHRADSRLRIFIANTYKVVLRLLFGLRVRDVDCAFKLFRLRVAREVQPRSGGAFFSAEFLLRARAQGFSIAEVGVSHRPRAIGTAKGATPAVILRTFREMFGLWWSFRRAPRNDPAGSAGRNGR